MIFNIFTYLPLFFGSLFTKLAIRTAFLFSFAIIAAAVIMPLTSFAQLKPAPPMYIPAYIYPQPLIPPPLLTDGTEIDRKVTKTSKDDAVTENDTTKKKNRITILESGDVHELKIYLKDYNTKVTVSVYNLLGKKVMEVFRGTPMENVNYPIQSWKLPNGVYICAVHGKDFRLTEKFYVSR